MNLKEGQISVSGKVYQNDQIVISPESPNVQLNGILGAFLGLFFGLGMALIGQTMRQVMHRIWPSRFVGRHSGERAHLEEAILSYERQRQLLGLDESSEYSSLISNGLLDTVTEACMKVEFELCQEDHIIHQIMPAWLGSNVNISYWV